ncbi:MAG TPA: hypothetical protein VLE74_00730 [Candidatus Saccharimonadales bacterium]|nr:hypothetical protein [Candidatus Saccharimonadales bacterium]
MAKSYGQPGGFSAVQVLLVIILIAIIAFAGWYVWLMKRDADKTSTAQTTTAPASQQKTAKNTITFVELNNFQIEVPDTLKDLIYTVRTPDAGTTEADLSTTSLKNLDPKCAPDGPNGTPLGWFTKTAGKYPSDISQATGVLLQQYPDYYIAYKTPQAACSDNKAAQDLSIQQLKLLKAALNQSSFATKIQ